ncbi:MAG: hypothetical protein OSB55_13245 [Verrucomicrobiota bacterium]|nr:hypothetical protein [Verrucomicrobiota bacterium]
MSTKGKPSLWKWNVMKSVIAALVLYVGYEVFVNEPTPEPLAPTQDELDSLSGSIELIEASEPEAKPEETPKPPADAAPLAAAPEPPPNLVELVQPIVEAKDDLLPEMIDGYEGVSFDKLASFAYEVPLDPVTNKVELAKLNAQIPARIKSLDKKSVAIRGFMLPLKVENGLVTELLIMRDQSMCCFGTVPKINEWINIRMEGDGVQPIMDQSITLMGQLKVGEVLENDYLVGIYEMEGDKMIGPLDL